MFEDQIKVMAGVKFPAGGSGGGSGPALPSWADPSADVTRSNLGAQPLSYQGGGPELINVTLDQLKNGPPVWKSSPLDGKPLLSGDTLAVGTTTLPNGNHAFSTTLSLTGELGLRGVESPRVPVRYGCKYRISGQITLKNSANILACVVGLYPDGTGASYLAPYLLNYNTLNAGIYEYDVVVDPSAANGETASICVLVETDSQAGVELTLPRIVEVAPWHGVVASRSSEMYVSSDVSYQVYFDGIVSGISSLLEPVYGYRFIADRPGKWGWSFVGNVVANGGAAPNRDAAFFLYKNGDYSTPVRKDFIPLPLDDRRSSNFSFDAIGLATGDYLELTVRGSNGSLKLNGVSSPMLASFWYQGA